MRPETQQVDRAAHIDDTISSLRRLREEQQRRYSPLARGTMRVTAWFSRPGALVALAAGAAVWIALNVTLPSFGRSAFDPPPFFWLDGATSLLSLCLVIMILTTQRADDELARRRELLSLELAVLSEQKTAKVIRLLEEFRRDSPQVRDRIDREAENMAVPSHPDKVLEAISMSAADEDGSPEPSASASSATLERHDPSALP